MSSTSSLEDTDDGHRRLLLDLERRKSINDGLKSRSNLHSNAKGIPVSEHVSLQTFLRVFWPLPLVAFGGPHACVALLFATFVDGTRSPGDPQLSEARFLELYALSQSLPGPNSTKMAALLGASFGGSKGAVYATILWLFPGFIAMSLAGTWFHAHRDNPGNAEIVAHLSHYAVGLIASAFAFVLIAAFKLVHKIVDTNKVKAGITTVASAIAVLAPARHLSWICIVLLSSGGTAFTIASKFQKLRQYSLLPSANVSDVTSDDDNDNSNVTDITSEENDLESGTGDRTSAISCTKENKDDGIEDLNIPITKSEGIVFLVIVAAITAILFLPPRGPNSGGVMRLARVFWRIGLCVYGGALVIVPLLLTEFVNGGLLPENIFLAAFGLFGCIPGPMVNLVAFLGAAVLGLPGALLGAVAVNSPGIMLQLGLVPFWTCIRRFKTVQTFLQGANAAAAGLIVAGVWMLLDRALTGPAAFVMTVSAGAMAVTFKAPMPLIVAVHGVLGAVLHHFGVGLTRGGN